MSRRSLLDWKIIVEQQLTSGLIAAEFCRQNNINQKYYSYYKCKLKSPKTAFIKVEPEVVSLSAPSVFYKLACNGVSFQYDHNSDAKFIAQLLRELQS